MGKSRSYSHFCPVARSLEVIGEKWSLLLVRDLLRGPQRFTDLVVLVGGITPKWLTQRLRDLEQAGIVEAERKEGRREVWYRLTPKGEALAPVIEALAVWGIDHALRPPRPDETIHPAQTMAMAVIHMNNRSRFPERPATWSIEFGPDKEQVMTFDGGKWRAHDGPAEAPDVRAHVTPLQWVSFLSSPADERKGYLDAMAIEGEPDRVQEFRRLLGGRRAVEA